MDCQTRKRPLVLYFHWSTGASVVAWRHHDPIRARINGRRVRVAVERPFFRSRGISTAGMAAIWSERVRSGSAARTSSKRLGQLICLIGDQSLPGKSAIRRWHTGSPSAASLRAENDDADTRNERRKRDASTRLRSVHPDSFSPNETRSKSIKANENQSNSTRPSQRPRRPDTTRKKTRSKPMEWTLDGRGQCVLSIFGGTRRGGRNGRRGRRRWRRFRRRDAGPGTGQLTPIRRPLRPHGPVCRPLFARFRLTLFFVLGERPNKKATSHPPLRWRPVDIVPALWKKKQSKNLSSTPLKFGKNRVKPCWTYFSFIQSWLESVQSSKTLRGNAGKTHFLSVLKHDMTVYIFPGI